MNINYREIWLYIERVERLFSSIINVFMDLIPDFTDVYCLFIVIIAFYSYKKTHERPAKYIEALKLFTDRLHGYEGVEDGRTFYEYADNCADEFIRKHQKDEYIVRLFNRFKRAIRMGDFSEAAEVFTYENVIMIPGKREIYELMPGAFTGLGILGTFLGLVQGLNKLHFSGGQQALEQGINGLISGMYLAFITSVVGLVASLLWSWLDRRRLHRYNGILDAFADKLQDIKLEETVNYLKEIKEIQEEERDVIKTLATDLALELENVMSSVNENLISHINDNFNEVMSQLMKSNNEFQTILNNFSNVASQSQIEGINRVVDKFLASMDETLKGKFDDLAKSIDKMINWQSQIQNNMSGLIDEIMKSALNIKDVNTKTEDMLTKFSQFFDRLNSAEVSLLDSVSTLKVTSENIIMASEEVSNILERIGNDNEKFFQNSRDVLSIIIEYTEKIDNTYKRYSETYERINHNLDMLNNNLKESMEEFANKTHDGLRKSFTIFDEELSKIVADIESMAESISESVEDLPAAIANFKNN